jgi:c-di-GMP-binding flagellar brake protein YcgR
MTFYAEKISSLEKGVAKVVCEHTLSRLQSRIVSFEEQVALDIQCPHSHTACMPMI